ncbi:MAG: tRNA(Cytosine32)-2-thiocytidine synthetase [uncultured Campylobacterales bacterium]|uniref:tRNA(Cytosine32)-2-thiocytidine synthetase n=1 Tax=uncultured Campylobacterales bacterium TaxID=352960 RepID=A0A6S6TKE5_9BACT|nr:MAG: tRNA(Cytosine32)-2-thiocytidine synthetase [uncultured Campylobacterales bacterium]
MVKISKSILSLAGKTNGTYGLIKEGDKVLVGLSGGKDSFTLTHTLKHIQRVVPFDFHIKAVTVNYGMPGEDYSFITKHCEKYGIEHEVIQTKTFELAGEKIRKNSSFCSFFSRMRRGALYGTALAQGYNKLALGHHLDDAVESFFMNFTYNGSLRSLPPVYTAENGVEVIRPLIMARERQLAECAKLNDFPVIGDEACPAFRFDVKMPRARAEAKELLATLESSNKDLFVSLKKAFTKIHQESFFVEPN